MTTRRYCDGGQAGDEWSGCPHGSETGERLGWGWTCIYDRDADMFRHLCPKCRGLGDEPKKRKR
jgi:hypothetical protein